MWDDDRRFDYESQYEGDNYGRSTDDNLDGCAVYAIIALVMIAVSGFISWIVSNACSTCF